MKSKKYFFAWEDFQEKDIQPVDLVEQAANDPELDSLNEIIIGNFCEVSDESIDPILDKFVQYKDKFQHIQSFFMGDIEAEECEVSWIEQGNYEAFINSFPNMKKLTIKGGNNLRLGVITSNNLEELTIISGGLGKEVLNDLINSKLPNLKSLILYLGIPDYGFDATLKDIQPLLSKKLFPNLEILGLVNSEIEDDIIALVLNSDILSQLQELHFSYGTLTDQSGELIIKNKDKLSHLQLLDIHFHYLSDEMIEKLKTELDIPIDISEQQVPDVYDDETFYYTFLSE